MEIDEGGLIAKIMSLDTSDKKKLAKGLDDLIKVRMWNERRVGEGVAIGLESEEISVQEAIGLLGKSKDSLKDLLIAKAGAESGSFEGERYVLMREGAVERAEAIVRGG